MPEEINRQVTGVIADLHCAPTVIAAANLRAEGVPEERIRVTGNTIVEAVADSLPAPGDSLALLRRYGVTDGGFVLVTLHRPENTDDPGRLRLILAELGRLGLPVLFPVHPRTLRRAEEYGLRQQLAVLGAVDPVDHTTFLGLARHARLLVSDSGGVQEECTVLKKPLVVLRNSTERPEAVDAGFAILLRPGPGLGRVARGLIADTALAGRLAARPSPYGDGRAAERIVELTLALAGLPAPAVSPHTSPAPSGVPAHRRAAAGAAATVAVTLPVPSL